MTEKLLTDEYKSALQSSFKRVRGEIESAGGKDVVLLAATKTLSAEIINYAVDELGLTHIGENRVQELVAKYDELHKDGLHVHFIGRLQKNKVKYIVDKVEMIESLDSFELAETIDRQCAKIGKVMDVLVEVNIGNEESKGGVSESGAAEFVEKLGALKNIRVCGLMVIPPVGSSGDYEKYFKETYKLYVDIFGERIHNNSGYILSMGMSDSYVEAVRCGSGLVRIGSALFGKREYKTE